MKRFYTGAATLEGVTVMKMCGAIHGRGGFTLIELLASIADEDREISDQPQGAGNGNGGGNVVYRLREGIERFLITDINNPGASASAQSTVFIMMDQLGTGAAIQKFNHLPGGCNVLYMDGHVEFVRYVSDNASATPPVTPAVAVVTGALSGG